LVRAAHRERRCNRARFLDHLNDLARRYFALHAPEVKA
jgi:hypothetical protein